MKVSLYRNRLLIEEYSKQEESKISQLMGVSKTELGYAASLDLINLRLLLTIENVILEENLLKYLQEETVKIEKAVYLSGKEPIPLDGMTFLKEHQLRAVEFFKAMNHKMVLADDRGFGKTLTAIACTMNFKKVLIVCPSYLKYSWQREITQWIGEKSFVCEGERAARTLMIEKWKKSSDIRFLITNYEMFRLKVEVGGYPILHSKYECIILDEAHRVKSRDASQTKGLKKCKSNSWLLLTGNPISNAPQDMWQLLNFLYPDRFSSFWNYVEYFCECLDSFFGKEIIGMKNSKIKEHQYILQSIMLRRLKEGLPEKIYKKITFPLEGKQKKAYQQAKKDFMLEREDGSISVIESKLTQLMRLNQIAIDPDILGIEGKPKLFEVLLDLLKDINSKVVIGCIFVHSSKRIQKFLQSKNYTVFLINGETPSTNKDAYVQAFKKASGNVVLVGTISSMGEGFSIDECDHMIFTDRSFMVSQNEQFEDRIHRLNSVRDKFYYELIPMKTVVEKKYKMLANKTRMINNILDDSELVDYLLREEIENGHIL